MLHKLVRYIKLDRFFKIIIESFELPKGQLLRLVTLAYVIVGLIWLIWLKAENFFQWLGTSQDQSTNFKYLLTGLVSIIFTLFFVSAIISIFSLERRVRILVRSYSEDDEIIILLNNKIKEWLTVISDLTKNKPNEPRKYTDHQLDKMQKDISNRGRYLESLVTEVGNFLELSKQSIEDLIGFKIGVNKNIAKNIIYNYKQIQKAKIMLNLTEPENKEYYENQINEKLKDLEKKERILRMQINWNKQLEEHRGDIKTLIQIIKEESTGNAIITLVELLKKARTSEQLKFLIQAANAREGYKLGELLGFKLVLRSNEEILTWYDYDKPIPESMPIEKPPYIFKILRKIGIVKKDVDNHVAINTNENILK